MFRAVALMLVAAFAGAAACGADDAAVTPGVPEAGTGAPDAAAADAAVDASASPDCFTREANAKLPFHFLQQTPPPGDAPETSAAYPADTYAWVPTGPIPSGATSATHAWAWSNRCIYLKDLTPDSSQCRNGGDKTGSGIPVPSAATATGTKGNWYPAPLEDPAGATRLFAAFPTYALARSCTHYQVRRILGESFAALVTAARTDDPQLTLVDGAAADRDTTLLGLVTTPSIIRKSDAGTYAWTAERMLVDVCVLPAYSLAADSTGILLDHERQDTISAADNLAFVQSIANRVHAAGKKLVFYTNALVNTDATVKGAGYRNGIDSTNVVGLFDAVDWFSPIVWSGATAGNPETFLDPSPRRFTYGANFDAQLQFLTSAGISGARLAKLVPAIALSDLNAPQAIGDADIDPNAGLPEAKYLHDTTLAKGLGGLQIWKNYATPGGSCTRPENQVLACLAFGTCDGTYR